MDRNIPKHRENEKMNGSMPGIEVKSISATQNLRNTLEVL